MRVKINEIRLLCEQVLQKHGLNAAQAKIVADDFIEGELLGKYSHGLAGFPRFVAAIGQAHKNKSKMVVRRKNAALIDARKGLGQLAAKQAIDLVVKMAKSGGIAMVGINSMLPFMRPGSQAEQISRSGMIGIVVLNGGRPLVAPPGGIEKIISTNPIGFAIPTADLPIVADMAISKHAWGKVRQASMYGKKLPANSYQTKTGAITVNPKDAFSALPFGDYKGFNLGVLFEVLTGSLIRSGMGKTKETYRGGKKAYRGATFIAINPMTFTSLTKFKRQNSAFIKQLSRAKRQRGVSSILVAGQVSQRKKMQSLKRGWLDIDKVVFSHIEEL